MTDETITRLRADLAGKTGSERAMALMRLAQEHMNLFWRIGPGTPASRPHLDEGLTVIEEAYELFGPQDTMRGQVGLLYGVMFGWKNALGSGTERDRERAIELVEQSFTVGGVPPFQQATGRVMLGQLYMERATRPLQTQEMMMQAMTGGLPKASIDDLDRAADCFREVIKASMNAEMTNTATAMLSMCELFRDLLGGIGPGFGGMDLGRMSTALSTLQGMQAKGFGLNLAGPGIQPGMNLMDMTKTLINMDPLDRPVPVIHGPEPDQPFEATAPPPTVSVDVEALRRQLTELISVDGNGYGSIISLLRTEQMPSWIDDAVSLATRVVHAAEPAVGTDHLLLAVALILRSRRDGDGGWDEDDAIDSDVEAAVESLLAAASTVPGEQPEATALLLQLAMMLPEGTIGCLSDSFAEVSTAVRALGAGALLFGPEMPWLDAPSGRLMPPDAPCHAQHVVVFEDGAEDVEGDKAVTYLASTAQLLDVSRREPRSLTEKVVFVANPRGDRESATVDALLLRRSFYPSSTGLGRLVENTDGTGTADQVQAAFDSSLLQLGCGLGAGGVLELADGTELDLTTLGNVRGGLVILPPGVFLPAADRLLAAGCTGVIGWRRAVSAETAALMLFVLHTELAETGRNPAAAVRAVRGWAGHPDVDRLPVLLAGFARRAELLRDEDWSALVYRGR